MKFIMIGALGVIGVYLRYALSLHAASADHSNALATLVANLIGCLIAGSIFALIQIRGESFIYTAILVGLCGGLTTFSGYNLEFLNQLNEGLYSKALMYFICGPLLGFSVLTFGYFTTQKIFENVRKQKYNNI